MELKGIFVKNGEEAYALEAFTSDKLRDMGMIETARDNATGDRYYEDPGSKGGYRLVRTAGSAKDGIVDYGQIAREVRVNGRWKRDVAVSLEDFVNKENPFAPKREAQSGPATVAPFAGR